jgi:diadenosine tetraphosphate (Ap4A) HIT family hydrolase
MPDKFPLTPGHTLVISKEHLACYGAGPAEIWRELEESAAIVRRFLFETFGGSVLAWENGVSGQSVFHAHLHLIPLPIGGSRFDPAVDPAVIPISGWQPVRERYLRDGSYRYLELLDRRYLLPAYSPAVRDVTRLIAASTGLRFDARGWIKTTTPEDVEEVRRRWAEWRERAAEIV